MPFRLAPKSMTLDDLERPKRRSCRKEKFYGAHHKNFNEDRPILSAAKYGPMILVSTPCPGKKKALVF